MTDSLPIAVLGFLLGMRHAVDPDHVVAVTAITARHPSISRSAIVGALWGLGHTLTLLLVGGSIVLFKVAISARVGVALELSVAGMLVCLGFSNLMVVRTRATPAATPSGVRPLIVGAVHGLAGSAAVALLVVGAVSSPAAAIGYLLLFGLGTVMGMLLVTLVVAMPARLAINRVASARRWLTLASGIVSVVMGIWLARELTSSRNVSVEKPAHATQ
jgi:high-affinity nickel-transport protein